MLRDRAHGSIFDALLQLATDNVAHDARIETIVLCDHDREVLGSSSEKYRLSEEASWRQEVWPHELERVVLVLCVARHEVPQARL